MLNLLRSSRLLAVITLVISTGHAFEIVWRVVIWVVVDVVNVVTGRDRPYLSLVDFAM